MSRKEAIKDAVEQRRNFLDPKNKSKILEIDAIVELLKKNSDKIIEEHINKEGESQIKRNEEIFGLIKEKYDKGENFIEKSKIFSMKIEEIYKKSFKEKFAQLHSNDLERPANHYVWISFTSDGNAFVVGKTNFEATTSEVGDLGNKISLFQRKPIEILINVLSACGGISKNEKKPRYFIMNQDGIMEGISTVDILEEINEELGRFITQAIVIPLDVNSISHKQSKGVASIIEKAIGEYLVNLKDEKKVRLVPMIDGYSHQGGKKPSTK